VGAPEEAAADELREAIDSWQAEREWEERRSAA